MRRGSPFGAQEPMAEASAANKRLDHRRVAPQGRFRRPRLYLVGEAPGAAEAAQGKPFVGPAGNALRKMLKEGGIDPGQLRLANAGTWPLSCLSPAGLVRDLVADVAWRGPSHRAESLC